MKARILSNDTPYRTDDVRKILTAVLAQYHKRHTKPETVRVRLKLYYKRGSGWCSGFAWYNSDRIDLLLPKSKAGYDWQDGKHDTIAEQIAGTFWHELRHCAGLEHSDMCDHHYRGEDFSYVKDFPVRDKSELKARPKTDKLIRLRQRRDRWEGRLRRAAKAVRKLERSIRAIERHRSKELDNHPIISYHNQDTTP